MTENVILVTVDLEDWFQVENLRGHFPHSCWETCESRVHASTKALLELFDQHDIKCTFFVLGWIAERYPEIVQQIASQGHEIASHGYGHRLCTGLNRDDLRDDLQKSKKLLEGITGQQVTGYRAPSFSVTSELIDLLAETGHRYDSSYNSFGMNSRYGKLEGAWSKTSGKLIQSANGIYEIPVSNLEIAGRVFPWGGGGFFRLYPLWLFCRGVQKILKQQQYYLFYCHPWEFDPGQPRAKGLRPDYRFRHYVGIEDNLNKLDSFLSMFSDCTFKTCSAFTFFEPPASLKDAKYAKEEQRQEGYSFPTRRPDAFFSVQLFVSNIRNRS